ncbi:MAG: methyltransferase domain-containing protein [Candidatus Woesearchaeota archaeon]
MNYILSSEELRKMNDAIKHGKTHLETSLDLGITKAKVTFKDGKIVFPNAQEVEPIKIRDDDKTCYLLDKDKLLKVQFFSDETNKLYKLVPTQNKPILKISATPMHKMLFVEKIKKAQLKGEILDSGTGLGYTAIAAANHAKHVTTIELDPNVIEVAKLNPWSQELFTKINITQKMGDLTEEVKKFKNEQFDNIILDAGTIHESGDFFAAKNYIEVFRVLKKGGHLYHYLPQVGINKGRDFIGEIMKKLKEAGFRDIKRDDESSSVQASKA